jgi:hypothetical protein
MVVEQAVSNHVLDMGLRQRTAEPPREILDVEKIDVVADKGYFRTEDIASCEEAGLTPHVPRPQRGAAVSGCNTHVLMPATSRSISVPQISFCLLRLRPCKFRLNAGKRVFQRHL